MWVAFVVVDVWARPPPPRISSDEVVTQERRGVVWTTWMATHAISYGIYIANAEFVAWVMKRKGRGEDKLQGLEGGEGVGVRTGKTRGLGEKARHTESLPKEDEQVVGGETPPSDMSSLSSSYSSLSSIPVSSSSDLDHHVAHHYHLPRRPAAMLPATVAFPPIDLCVTDISSSTATFFWTVTPPASTSSSSSSSSSSDESTSSAHRPRRSRREDVLVYVDSVPWLQDNLGEAVAGANERGIIVRELRSATEYAVEVMIRMRGKGWRCGRARVCTAAAGRGGRCWFYFFLFYFFFSLKK